MIHSVQIFCNQNLVIVVDEIDEGTISCFNASDHQTIDQLPASWVDVVNHTSYPQWQISVSRVNHITVSNRIANGVNLIRHQVSIRPIWLTKLLKLKLFSNIKEVSEGRQNQFSLHPHQSMSDVSQSQVNWKNFLVWRIWNQEKKLNLKEFVNECKSVGLRIFELSVFWWLGEKDTVGWTQIIFISMLRRYNVSTTQSV